MYTREEASKLKQSFWTAFGQYISPHLSVEGIKVNWVNYKTGIRHVFFRMNAEKDLASISIDIAHPDLGMQEIYFQQFEEMKGLLHGAVGEEWAWDLHTYDENGKTISRIYKELRGASVFNEEDWPALISFFKPRIIALDEFWSDARYVFEDLESA